MNTIHNTAQVVLTLGSARAIKAPLNLHKHKVVKVYILQTTLAYVQHLHISKNSELINFNPFLQLGTECVSSHWWKYISGSAAESMPLCYGHCGRFVDAPLGDKVSSKNDWRLNLQARVSLGWLVFGNGSLYQSLCRHLWDMKSSTLAKYTTTHLTDYFKHIYLSICLSPYLFTSSCMQLCRCKLCFHA